MTNNDADGGDTDTSAVVGTRFIDDVFPALNTRRVRYLIASGLALVSLGVAAVIAFSTGPLPTWLRQQLTSAVPALPVTTSQALLVGALGGLGVLYLRYDTTTGEQAGFLVDETAPPEASRNAPRIAGDTFDRKRRDALDEIRLKRVQYRETEPRQTLRELVRTVVQLSENCSAGEAERAVDDGTWTSDPVAQAFCSETIAYPTHLRLLRWARSDIAYETSLTRTTNALTRFVERELETRPATTASQDDSQPPTNWLETIETAIQGVWGAPQPTSRTDERSQPRDPEGGLRGDD